METDLVGNAGRSPRAATARLCSSSSAVVAAAFAFGFALVPLYDVLCAATGFNGKTSQGKLGVGGIAGPAAAPSRIDPVAS
jgi:cytochrome c oxidase assembly protein subunit 11